MRLLLRVHYHVLYSLTFRDVILVLLASLYNLIKQCFYRENPFSVTKEVHGAKILNQNLFSCVSLKCIGVLADHTQ